MDVKLLNPFIEAAVEVLKAEVDVSITRGALTLQKSALTTDDITVLINLIGDVFGIVMYSMPTSTGLNFVSKMMGQEFSELDSLAQSGVAELGNVISGRATIKFSQAGYKADISTPTVVTGKGIEISTLDFPRIVVPLETGLGLITVHLALRIKNPGAQPTPEDLVTLIATPGKNS